MCSKYVEAYNKFIVKQNFCASSWLITEINKSDKYCLHNFALTIRYTIQLRLLHRVLTQYRSYTQAGDCAITKIRRVLFGL